MNVAEIHRLTPIAFAPEALLRPPVRLNEARVRRPANRVEVIERESQTDPLLPFSDWLSPWFTSRTIYGFLAFSEVADRAGCNEVVWILRAVIEY